MRKIIFLTVLSLFTLSACSSTATSKTEVYGEMTGGVEHTTTVNQ